MIRITRSASPDVLVRRAQVARGELEVRYDLFPDEHLSGDLTLAVNAGLWGHDEVRAELRVMQHSKCCYCEVHMDAYTPRHVEHWRPKGGVKQTSGDPELKPGYYWEAYEWENLFLSCVVCNSVNKGVRFPLQEPALRARSHHDPVNLEQPLLLKPDIDDPDRHIQWVWDQPRGLSPEGRATIEVVGLIRDNDARRTRALKLVKTSTDRLLKYHLDHPVLAAELLQELREARRLESEFSAMVNAYLATGSSSAR